MSSQVDIIHVVPVDGIGGVEAAARSMAERERRAGERSFELVLIAGKSISMSGAAILPSPYRSPDNPLAQLRALRLVLRRRPRVLILSLWRSVPVGLLARLFRPSLRLVYFLHSERNRHLADRLLSGLAIRFADELWCDADATRRGRLQPCDRARTRVLSFVISRLRPLDTTRIVAPRFILWARLNRGKGVDRAIELIALLAEQGIDAQFDIYGPDDGDRQALIALAAERGIGDRVFFHGPITRDDLPTIAADASFFLQLSRFEGMAMAVVEAMQLGLIPVVTAVGEIGQYVKDGANGVIVDPDQLGQAAQRVKQLLGDPAAALRTREAAIATWLDKPLYADDVRAAAERLIDEAQDRQQLSDSDRTNSSG